MADLYVQKDEITPWANEVASGLSSKKMKRFFGDLGGRLVFIIKRRMDQQIAFGDGTPYRKLKIKWRYSGRKELVASRVNLKRAGKRGTVRDTVVGGRPTRVVSVVDKERVVSGTKALIYKGDLFRSWGVRDYGPGHVSVGPETPMEKMKALYNDDRGGWRFEDKAANEVVEQFLGMLDKYWKD